LCSPSKRATDTGMGWLRVVTDVPTAFSDMLIGRLSPAKYVESLRRTRIESVFSLEDPIPALAEIALLPYHRVKKYL
jgi:D-aspartate ligase